VNCLKNNFKFYIKIDIKTAPPCFGAVTPPSGSALLVLAKVTVVKIANYTKYIGVWWCDCSGNMADARKFETAVTLVIFS
jgi:hypothetical protein